MDELKQAINTMCRHYDEPLRLDDLARVATMSKFHFLRTFSHETGVTPARYLCAIRIQAAKRLLLSTSLDVAQISYQVGYGSLGTFTTRFTELVGFPPVRFRRLARGEASMPATGGDTDDEPADPAPLSGTVSGTVEVTRPITRSIMLGLFPTRIPQGQPVACTTVSGPGRWRMDGVPPGAWHLLGVTVLDDMRGIPGQVPFLVATPQHLRVRPRESVRTDILLRPVHWTDPPLLVALPGVDALITAPPQASPARQVSAAR
jgi:AraC family transcriptional regulator